MSNAVCAKASAHSSHPLVVVCGQLHDIPDSLEDKFMFEMTGSKKNIIVQAASNAEKYAWMTAVCV